MPAKSPEPRRTIPWRWLLPLAVIVLVLGLWSPVCIERSQVAISRDDPYQAEVWLDRAKWIPWSTAERMFLRARVSRMLGRVDDFAQQLKQADQLGVPKERLQLEVWLQQAQAGDLNALDEHLPRLLMAGEDLQEICNAYVLGCIMQFRIERAYETLKVWQADFPDDPRPPFLRGRLLEHQADLIGATREYQQALSKTPGYVPAAMNLARVELSQQNPEAALKHYQLAAEEMVQPQPALVGMARCQREMGDLAGARKTLLKALQSPKDQLVEAYRFVGERSETALAQAPAEMAQLELAEDHPEAALPWFQQTIEANPLDWKSRFTYGQTLRRVGRVAESEAEIARAEASRMAFESCDLLIDELRKDPGNVDARYQIGCVLLEHLSPNQGLVWLRSIFTYDPQHQAAHRKLAEYYEAHLQEHPEYARLAVTHRRAIRPEAP